MDWPTAEEATAAAKTCIAMVKRLRESGGDSMSEVTQTLTLAAWTLTEYVEEMIKHNERNP